MYEMTPTQGNNHSFTLVLFLSEQKLRTWNYLAHRCDKEKLKFKRLKADTVITTFWECLHLENVKSPSRKTLIGSKNLPGTVTERTSR